MNMKTICPLISHAVLVGDGRKFVSLLLTLKVRKNLISGYFTRELSQDARKFIKKRLNLSNITTVDDVLKCKEVMDYIQECIEECNKRAINRVSKVKKWVILQDELDVLTGELTPTMKVKRSYIAKKY